MAVGVVHARHENAAVVRGVAHRHADIDDAFAVPAGPVLVTAVVGVAAAAEHGARNDEVAANGQQIRVDPAQEIRHLPPPPVRELRARGRGLARQAELGVVTRDRRRIVARVRRRIADVIPVEAVHGVTADDIGGHDVIPHRGVRMARVEIVAFAVPIRAGRIPHQVLRVQIEDMAGLRRRRGAAPDHVGRDPAMHLDARRAGVRLVDDVLQRVEAGGNGRGLGIVAGNARGVEGVAPPPHLHDDGVEVVGPAIGDELRDLAGVEEARPPRIHPHAAKFVALGGRLNPGEQRKSETGGSGTAEIHLSNLSLFGGRNQPACSCNTALPGAQRLLNSALVKPP